MRKTATRFLTAMGSAALLVTATGALAADHRDAPAIRDDPAADINDIYTFMNPNDANELIIVYTMFPFADESSRFSDAVSYNLFLENNANPPQQFKIACVSSATQLVTCSGPNGLSASAQLGQTGGGNGFRLFAGLRDDPFFFDLEAFQQTQATLTPQFRTPGINTFAGANTLSIVLGLDRGSVTNNFTAPVLKIWGNTERLQ